MNKFINVAVDQALKSTQSYRHGAILFKGGKVHASSFNDENHAEIDCLYSLPRCKQVRQSRYNLLVVRVTRDGELTDSKPCLFCISHLRKSERIKSICYSTSDGKIVKESINSITTDHIPKSARCFFRNGGTIREFKIQCCLD